MCQLMNWCQPGSLQCWLMAGLSTSLENHTMWLSSLTFYPQIHEDIGSMLNKLIDGAKPDGRTNMLDDRVRFQKKSLGRPERWDEPNKIKKVGGINQRSTFHSEMNWRKTGWRRLDKRVAHVWKSWGPHLCVSLIWVKGMTQTLQKWRTLQADLLEMVSPDFSHSLISIYLVLTMY